MAREGDDGLHGDEHGADEEVGPYRPEQRTCVERPAPGRGEDQRRRERPHRPVQQLLEEVPLARIRELRPTAVIARHKRRADASDAPDDIDFMDARLADCDRCRKASANAPALAGAMRQKYPHLAVPMLLMFSAQMAFPP